MKASIITLGCKVNEYESQSIMRQLQDEGYEIAEGLVYADVYVVNTCAVTNEGERKSRQVLAKLGKLNPNAKIVVCGCAVQNNPSKFLVNENVIALTGNYGKHDIMSFIHRQNKILPDLEHQKYIDMARPIETRARQYIKIQDGCDYFCTYCIIPYLRGRSRSRDLEDILDEIRNTQAKEIVLTGINMSDYKIDGKLALKTLVKRVDELNKRFRISSIECMVLDDEMIEILKNCKNFCPHFHLSLQSACNATLKRMNRRYTIEEFKDIVAKIKVNFPSACISTDIIVGFKGETEQEFADTKTNLREIEFSTMHIFPYSERSGTNACRLDGAVDKATQKLREKELQVLNKEFKDKFISTNLGTKHTVLIEEVDENFSLGYTDNYIYTYVEGKHSVGEIVTVELVSPYLQGVIGKIKE
ncbi:MAG: tRNA (N(6)-L-threonylcarbamoyladenosine(37)-C(2))-methylthiotransferase MtaB [Clostridiales bacterium]|nr:tRNA (N(6)-L-threonylcarbamoyladenosine(37)-C(2))-methylthiotransferase MtaB [Clostridiales bacterium]